MTDASTRFGRGYLERQYANADNLRIRYETHANYSEQKESFRSWLLPFLDVRPGQLVCDAGCGPGGYHPSIIERGGRVLAMDLSAGMLREAREQPNTSAHVDLVQATAMRIPLRDAVCDRLLAAHMLYYVPDARGALLEMRHVLKARGRIIITANAGTPSRFDDIEREAADALGIPKLTANSAQRFSMDDDGIVRAVFPDAARYVREDALVFPSAEPAMRYWMSFAPDQLRSDGERQELLPPLADEMRARIERIVKQDGAFRVAKGAGCFVSER